MKKIYGSIILGISVASIIALVKIAQNPIILTERIEVRQDIPLEITKYRLPNGTECSLKSLEQISDFLEYFTQRLFPCNNRKRFGGIKTRNSIDGDKWVCLDEIYNIKPNNCRVLSFGINYEWSFDDDMDKFGCKVYAFDPTMKNAENHKRSENIQFFKKGLEKKKGKLSIGEVDTYEGILKMLKLENTNIDYIKMDIEGHELGVFDSWFYDVPEYLLKIKQIGMEIHPGPFRSEDQVKGVAKVLYKYFQLLKCFGFQLAFSHLNTVNVNLYEYRGRQQSQCYELVWVNPKQW